MKIASSELQMASSHASLQQHEIKESLRMWVGPQRPDFPGDARSAANRPSPPPPAAPRETVTLSDAGLAAASTEGTSSLDEPLDDDPKTTLIRMMLEMLTGKRAKIFRPEELQDKHQPVSLEAPPGSHAGNAGNTATADRPAGYGIEYDYRESYRETEHTRFAADGIIKTADGREIRFNLELAMSREYREESSVSLRLGDAARKVDPLVLNFAGNAAQLLDQRFSFDLNADGSDEQIARLASGSAYLVFDHNDNKQVDDGSELFGPRTGNGFTELAALDDDQNGWIDENDSAFNKLQLWSPDASGQGKLKSLADFGVGAIALSHIGTPFDLKNSQNALLGQIRSSGIFLHENGSAGTIQQIDLTV